MTIERAIYEFLRERVAASAEDAPVPFSVPGVTAEASTRIVALLRGLEVLPDEHANIATERGVRIGEATARVAPNFQGDDLDHFDVLAVLIIYRAVARGDNKRRSSYRDEVVELANALGTLFLREPDMRNLATGQARVNNCRPLRVPRGGDNIDGKPYAVSNVQLVVNETGVIDFTGR